MTQAYCGKCKKKVEIENLRTEVMKNNHQMLNRGKCPECGGNVASFSSGNLERQEQEVREKLKFVPQPLPTISHQELNSKPTKMQNFEEIADDWKEKANKNPILKKNGLKVVNSNIYVFLIIGMIGTLIILGVFVYLYADGRSKSDISLTCPNISMPECPACPTCPACNNYCNPIVNITIPIKINTTANSS